MATYLTQHATPKGPRWAMDGYFLPETFGLSILLSLPAQSIDNFLQALPAAEAVQEPLLPPIQPAQEVWASGVTYLRSREAREAESDAADVYTRVYDAARPELFLKAIGWRVAGHGEPIRVRQDSRWSVPEPELTLVVNRHQQIVGFCAGNDVSSRDIEGENPLYLPQAKFYRRSCALGPGILITQPGELADLPVQLEILRSGEPVFQGETRTSHMKRSLEELVAYLGRELDFPYGVFLMTGTGVVPPVEFTLLEGDLVRVQVGSLMLENAVQAGT